MTRLVVPWDEIATQWEEREYGALRDTVSRFPGFAAQDVEALLLDTEPTPEVALRVLDDAFAAAGLDTDARLALALYVYSRCLERWEQTEDYEPIRTVVTALEAAAHEADGTADGRSELLAIVVGQAQLLDVAMNVEDAMNCSCPVAMGARAGKVVGGLVSLLERERELGDGPARLRAIVRSDAEMTRRYFEAIADTAKAVKEFVDRDAPGPARFHGVLESLVRAEQAIARKGDVYESELRAHRVTLEALRDRAEEPRLRVDAAEVVYLYPFALDIDAETAVERTLRHGFARVLTEAGLRPARVA